MEIEQKARGHIGHHQRTEGNPGGLGDLLLTPDESTIGRRIKRASMLARVVPLITAVGVELDCKAAGDRFVFVRGVFGKGCNGEEPYSYPKGEPCEDS
jgi:hypothetical protein